MCHLKASVLAVVCLFAWGVLADNVAIRTAANKNWNASDAWKDETGASIAYPNATTWTACFTNVPSGNYYYTTLNDKFTIGSLVGHPQHELTTDSGTDRKLTLLDPTGFLGYWTLHASGGRETFSLPSGCVAKPTFGTVESGARVIFSIADAATTARVDYVQQAGELVLSGDGSLSIGQAQAGLDAKVYVAGTSTGAVILDGHVPGETYAPPAKGLYLHLDASDATTLQTTETSFAGKTWTSVTNWLDVRKNGMRAWPYWKDRPAHISAVASPSGLPLVSLGAFKGGFCTGKSAATHPTVTNEALHGVNTTLQFAKTSKIREVFAVYQEIEPSWAMAAVIGCSDSYEFHPGEGNKQIQGGSGANWVQNGIGFFNGRRYSLKQNNDSNLGLTASLFTLSIGTLANAEANFIGSDRNYRNGGMRYGEILIYTNQLTTVERAQVNEYLERKWRGPKLVCGTCDYGAVFAPDARTAPVLSVPSNRVASVRRVRPFSKKFVKEGKGRLEVDYVYPANTTVEVRDGTFALGTPTAAIPDTEPGGDPAIWLDASTDADMSITNSAAGTRFVTGWHDCRAGHTAYATNGFYNGSTYAASSGTPYPGHFVANTLNEMGGVSFTGPNGYMKFVKGSTYAYSGFVVVRQDSTEGECPNFFGSSTQWMKRQYSEQLIGTGYGAGQTLGGSWTIDGVPYDSQESFSFGTSTFWVIGFTTESAATLNYLAKDRDNVGHLGKVTICEYLSYTNRLTEAERQQTVAYLLKRWKKKAHPESALATGPNLSFAADLPATVESASDLTIKSVSGGNGTLVKRGTGAVTLTGMSYNESMSMTDLAVEEGSLSVAFAQPAAIHLDANVAATLQTQVVPGVEDGSLQTNVVKWSDLSGNGAYAASTRQGKSVTNATLVTCATGTGRAMKVLDFGGANASTSASLNLSGAGDSVREAHIVFRDRDAHASFIFTDSDYYPYHRSDGGVIAGGASDPTYASYSHNGKVRVDAGAPVGPTAKSITDFDFHVVSAWTSGGAVPLRTIARDRNARAGGILVGEYLLFKETNTTAYADFLTRSLNYKWLGKGERPVWTNSLSSLSVAAGSTFTSPQADVTWRVATLKGAGTVTGTDLLGLTALEPTGNLTITGAVVAPGAVAVTYRGEIPRGPGVYTILTAGSLDIDLTQWTLSTPKIPRGYQARLKRDATHVYMQVIPPGLTVIVR